MAHYASELDAVVDIKAMLAPLPVVKAEIVERSFEALIAYKAKIAVWVKDGSVTPILLNGFLAFVQSSDKNLELLGTRKDMQELEFEIILFEADCLLQG